MEEGWDWFGKEGQDGGGVAGMILTIWAPCNGTQRDSDGMAGGGVAYGEEGSERGGV